MPRHQLDKGLANAEQLSMTPLRTTRSPPDLRVKRRSLKSLVVRDWLAEAISNGVFARGELLPSEHVLMGRFDVCRATVRQALQTLCRWGIVTARHGKGYYVSRLTAVSNLERLQSFGEMMAPLGLATRSNVIELGDFAACKDVAAALAIELHSPVTRIVRTRIAGGTVISLDVSFFPVDIGQQLFKLDLTNNDVFLLLEQQLGLELGYADLQIDTAACEPSYARHLGVGEQDTVLRMRRLSHDGSGRAIDYERIYARLDALRFCLRVARW